MVDGHGLGQDDMVLFCQPDRFLQFLSIEGNGLLTEHMLAGRQRLAQVPDVRIVRGRDIDDVDVRVIEHVVHVIVDFRNAVLFRERDSFVVGAVRNRIQHIASACQRFRQLMGNDAGAKGRPVEFCHDRSLLSRKCL